MSQGRTLISSTGVFGLSIFFLSSMLGSSGVSRGGSALRLPQPTPTPGSLRKSSRTSTGTESGIEADHIWQPEIESTEFRKLAADYSSFSLGLCRGQRSKPRRIIAFWGMAPLAFFFKCFGYFQGLSASMFTRDMSHGKATECLVNDQRDFWDLLGSLLKVTFGWSTLFCWGAFFLESVGISRIFGSNPKRKTTHGSLDIQMYHMAAGLGSQRLPLWVPKIPNLPSNGKVSSPRRPSA